MEKSPQSFDVCIVCALSEEARVFLEVLQRQCEKRFEEAMSPRYHYSYRFITLKNDKDEPLKLHVSWLPRYGSEEMTLHLTHVLEEYQPRIAIMTGICAGDPRHVQLGDLVVAERTFTYDNGKFTLDKRGKRLQLHDTMTYQLDANMLQFLGLFDQWKSLVKRMKRPPSLSEERKRRKLTCHITPMASGNAVREDHPFEEVQAPVRGAVAIDMEGAAFGRVMSRHPHIPWLVVKGVCDYADKNKNDAYHDYAARASALYAFSFIQAYVTNERLPPPDSSSHTARMESIEVWNVPYRRNSHFTGREDLLNRLQQQLAPPQQSKLAQARRVALTQPHAIKGLGGIGKTQIAVEYAYRSREYNRYMHTLRINAATEETLITSFMEIAELLPHISEKDEIDQQKIVEAVKRWLERCEQSWLLIFDNADDLALVRKYLPQQGNGSILITTRANAVGSLAGSLEVETMGFVEGTQLLLRRAQRFEHASDEGVNQAGNIVVALDHFPLALDQAGAYLEETGCSFADYLEIYQNHRNVLLARRGQQAVNYPESVATTWSLSFTKVQQANPAAAELLHLCAFLAPDRIPEELIKEGAAHWPALLQQAATDPFVFNQMIEELLKFSLVKRLVKDRVLSIHRLVQAVQRDWMDREVQCQWAGRVVRAVNTIFPDPQNINNWEQCLRYLDQTQTCSELIEDYGLTFIEAANIQNQAGIYLDVRGLYALAEPVFKRALRINEQQLGEHLDTATSLDNLAVLYQKQGRYKEAEPLLARTLAIREKLLEPEHPNMTQSLNNLAALYQAQGQYEKAEPLLARALTICEQHMGPEHPKTIICLNNLAVLYQAQGLYEKAESLLVRILAIREKQLEPEHPDIAKSLHHLAALYQTRGRYEEAESLYQRALAIREKQLEPEHPDIAKSLGNLAALYQAQSRYKEAESLLARALAIKEKQLGHEHPSIAQILHLLATLYQTQGRYEEAETLHQRALTIREKQLGPEHPDIAKSLHNLAAFYYMQRRYKEAEPLLARALAISQQKLGPGHPQTQQMMQMRQIVSYCLALLSKIDKSEDLESLSQLLVQKEPDKDKDKDKESLTEEDVP